MHRDPNLVIDLQQHRVMRDGVPVTMQRKTYDLLVFFARNPGRVLTKDAILRAVWPDTHVTEGSAKDVVKQLRRALDDDPNNPSFIATERGHGYRLLGEIALFDGETQLGSHNVRQNTDFPAARKLSFTLPWVFLAAVALIGVFVALSGHLPSLGQREMDSPSIAVLPFDNMSPDTNQEYLAEGITDDLITELSQLSGLFVIARNSTEIYSGRAMTLHAIADELGVRYILQGSVQRHENQIRINAQLVDTDTGHNLWAERFDAPAKRMLDVQPDIARKIVDTLDVRLSEVDTAQLRQLATNKPEAHDYVLRGHQLFRRMTPEDNRTAQELFLNALAIDPGYARAEALLGWSHWMASVSGWDTKPLDVALAHADQALALDSDLASARSLRAKVLLWHRRHAEAEAELRKTVSLAPNDYSAQGHLGDILVWSGKPDAAFVALERSLRLSPNDNGWILTLMGLGHFFAERNEDALHTLDRSLVRNPDYFWAHLLRAAVLGEMDRRSEAKLALEHALRMNSEFSLHFLKNAAPFGRNQDRQRVIEGLRAAGLER